MREFSLSDNKPELLSAYDLAMGERKFLHDISNKLLVVQGMSKSVMKKYDENQSISEKEIARLTKVIKASDEMIKLLLERRAILHENTKHYEKEEL